MECRVLVISGRGAYGGWMGLWCVGGSRLLLLTVWSAYYERERHRFPYTIFCFVCFFRRDYVQLLLWLLFSFRFPVFGVVSCFITCLCELLVSCLSGLLSHSLIKIIFSLFEKYLSTVASLSGENLDARGALSMSESDILPHTRSINGPA